MTYRNWSIRLNALFTQKLYYRLEDANPPDGGWMELWGLEYTPAEALLCWEIERRQRED